MDMGIFFGCPVKHFQCLCRISLFRYECQFTFFYLKYRFLSDFTQQVTERVKITAEIIRKLQGFGSCRASFINEAMDSLLPIFSTVSTTLLIK